MENVTVPDTEVWANRTSSNETRYNGTIFFEDPLRTAYLTTSGGLIFLCTVAVLINVRILVATRWLRRPISPTLFISLSLALADSISASLLATGLLINSLLPIVQEENSEPPNPCFLLALEATRLSCILVTMIHLLAQAGNHYLGIISPFKSRRWLTHNNVTCGVISIWLIPIIFIFGYFSSFQGQGFQGECDKEKTFGFYTKQRFRSLYSTLIFFPLIIMFFIYCHIYVIVKKHQASRQKYTRHSRHGREQEVISAQQLFDRNLKAIWTTLLILLSYMICLMPAVLSFSLLCDDCYIKIMEVPSERKFYVSAVVNFFLVTKPLLNPLIYASRMQEIRAATRRMNDSCRRTFYPSVSSLEPDTMLTNGGDELPRKSSFISRTSTRRHNYSVTSVRHVDNGFTKRSLRRRTEDATTDL